MTLIRRVRLHHPPLVLPRQVLAAEVAAQKFRTQNANAESRKPRRFFRSAFAFCVLNFRGRDARTRERARYPRDLAFATFALLGAAFGAFRPFSALMGMRATFAAGADLRGGAARLALSASIKSITCARGCSGSSAVISCPSIFCWITARMRSLTSSW